MAKENLYDLGKVWVSEGTRYQESTHIIIIASNVS